MIPMKKYLIAGLFISLALSIGFALAARPDVTPQLVNVNPSEGRATVIIPAHAVEVADDVFSLGTEIDVDGRVVEGFLFVDSKKAKVKPGTVCGNGVCEPGESPDSLECPAFFGVDWIEWNFPLTPHSTHPKVADG